MSVYKTSIARVSFSVSGSEDNLKDSYVDVKTSDIYQNNMPYTGGPMDSKMGTNDHGYHCQTCFNSKSICPGHEGVIRLPYPVWNPLFADDCKKWLKLICHKCGNPVIEDAAFAKYSGPRCLIEAQKLAKSSQRKCHYCHELHPVVKKPDEVVNIKKGPFYIEANYYEDKKLIRKEPLYPHKIKAILSRISDETCIKLGKSLLSHPRKFILDNIKVLPVQTRPDVKKNLGGKNTNDPLTTMLQLIIKKIDLIPAVLPNVIDPKLEATILDMTTIYNEFVRARGDDSQSLITRISGKQGMGRKNLLGKRVVVICRSTIINDATLRVNELRIPMSFAKRIQIEVVVQEYNRRYLAALLLNGTEMYPGAVKLIKKGTTIKYVGKVAVENMAVGDIVMRNVIDGDDCCFNRQPSLTPCQIATHKVLVCRDPAIKAIMMNVIACSIYKADFDGDAMHLIFASGEAARNEIASLNTVASFLTSCTNGGIAMGQVDDSIIGTAELTQSNVTFDRYHALMLFENIDMVPEGIRDGITGRELVSTILTPTPVNYKGTSISYRPSYTDWIKYDPNDTQVVIEQGHILSGVLDKSTIGGSGGLYNVLSNEYGPDKTLEIIYYLQQLAIGYIKQHGYSLGPMDMMVPMETKLEIDKTSADIINKSNIHTYALNTCAIIPPIGKTIEQFYEDQQMSALIGFTSFYAPIIKSIDTKNNALFKLINHGSKGDIANMVNMVSSIGQKIINGERMATKFGKGRALVYYCRFDPTPQSRGYIASSYIGGMNSAEFIANAMYCRFDFISNALLTSVTGMQSRISIKNLESMLISNLRHAVKDRNIIQLVYGEDYVDVRRMQQVKFPTALCNDKTLETYMHPDFPAFNEAIRRDRAEYRRIHLRIERMGELELISDSKHLGVHVGNITQDILKDSEADLRGPDAKTLGQMVSMVEALCKNIPYVLVNEIQERAQAPIPEYMISAVALLVMSIRSTLHPNFLVSSKMTVPVLRAIIDKVRLKYGQSLVDPGTAMGIIAAQSFSGPLTQYMLDSKHRSHLGGTSKNVMVVVKEVLGAKPVKQLINPSMVVALSPKYRGSEQTAQVIASSLEVVTLRNFYTLVQLFVEAYGNPVHDKYVTESKLIKDYEASNPLTKRPADLVNWCIRFEINRMTLILKNISLETIIAKLRQVWVDSYIVYTPENSPRIILRVYFRNIAFKSDITVPRMIALKEELLNTIIRGVDGVSSALPFKILRNEVKPDGSVGRTADTWGVKTAGTNLVGVVGVEGVLVGETLSDAVLEMAEIFGIEAARATIIASMRKMGTAISYRHYASYADEMTYTGKVTSIEATGLRNREYKNVLLRCGTGSTRSVLEDAALNNISTELTGVSSHLMVGQIPKFGTSYNQYYANIDMIQKHVPKAEDLLEALF